jgi:hypothetical protein
VEVPEGRDRHAAAWTTLWGVALPDMQGHLHGHRGDASGATSEVGTGGDERAREPRGEGRGPAAPATLAEAACALTAAPGKGLIASASCGLGQSDTQSVSRAEEVSVQGLRGKVDSMA